MIVLKAIISLKMMNTKDILGKTKKILSWITPLLIAVVLPASMLFYRAEDYTFVSGGLPFWAVSAVMTIGIAVIAAVLLYPVFKTHSEESDEIEDRKKSAAFGVAITVLVIAFLSFFLIESGIKHLNYLMDSEVPESITTKIVDKDYINRSKGKDTYQFSLDVDGERVKLEVPQSVYDDYKIGDPYTFSYYEGAFGEPFYMADEE